MEKEISGNYKHFKGNNYSVYCVAVDNESNRYVLYQQDYGDHAFWIRPYYMFFEQVEKANKRGNLHKVDRFKLSGKPKPVGEYIDKLILLIKKNSISIKHTETEMPYLITSVSKQNGLVVVQPDMCTEAATHCNVSLAPCGNLALSSNRCFNISSHEGYLTQFELIRRMGKNCCIIDDNLEVWDAAVSIPKSKQLIIDGYNNKDIENLINPCSIDLKIAEAGFLKTKFKRVDPESIEHASKASELWKRVKVKKDRNGKGGYIKLWPGQTILTHINNRIILPADCAGKIEIKSTYARLSLSITAGDFCNPGYNGFFPLEITNHGNHIVVLHTGSVMGQLMLIPVSGIILVEYSKKATQKNNNGIDDGTPYTFWLERSIKKIRKETGNELIIESYEHLRKAIRSSTSDDVNACRDRFDDGFLVFCQRRIKKERFKDKDNKPNIRKMIDCFISREKIIQSIYSIRWLSLIGGIINIFIPVYNLFAKVEKETPINNIKALLVIAIILFAGFILLQIKKPKAFCTFKKIDVEKALERVINQT